MEYAGYEIAEEAEDSNKYENDKAFLTIL